MADKVACPPALLPLIVGRGKFAQMWAISGTMGTFDAIALELANKGWSVADISAALVHHPSNRVTMTEAKRVALEAVAERLRAMSPDGEDGEGGPTVTVLAIYEQRPRTFLIQVGDEQFEVGSADIASPSALRKACIAAIAKVPDLPPAKKWVEWQREQFAAAERLEQPDEASESGNESAIIEMLLSALAPGDKIEHCMARRRYIEDGWQYIHGPRLYLLVSDQLKITVPRFYRVLRELGWVPGHPNNSTGARHWKAPYKSEAPLTFSQKLQLEVESRQVVADPVDETDYELDPPF